jgi:hypothetical protein
MRRSTRIGTSYRRGLAAIVRKRVTLSLLVMVHLSLLVFLTWRLLLFVPFGFPPFLTYWVTGSILLKESGERLVARRDRRSTKAEKFYDTLFHSSKCDSSLGVCLGTILGRDAERTDVIHRRGCREGDPHGTPKSWKEEISAYINGILLLCVLPSLSF